MPDFDRKERRKETDLLGVVLAGGLSSRLGHDKALVKIDNGENADLLAQAVNLLSIFCSDVVIVGRDEPRYKSIPDMEKGCGPVGGIATALTYGQGKACLVLSCDLPFMEESVLDLLVQKRQARSPHCLVTAYQQKDTGHVEALVSIYEYGCLPYFMQCIQAKLLKISLVVPMENQSLIPYPAEDSLPFFNINYPADLEITRRMMHMLGRLREQNG